MTKIDDAKARLPGNILSKINFTDHCWLWVGMKGGQNGRYGGLSLGTGRRKSAHRAVYECLVGPIPDGLVIDHLCRCTKCVNPDHLEAVTQRVNVQRGENAQRKKTHCPQGHPYDAENTVVIHGQFRRRECLVCARERKREWAARNRMAKKTGAKS